MNSQNIMEICIWVDGLNRRFLNHYFPQSGDSLGHASHPDELSNETSFPISFSIYVLQC